MPALHTGHTCLLGLVSNHCIKTNSGYIPPITNNALSFKCCEKGRKPNIPDANRASWSRRCKGGRETKCWDREEVWLVWIKTIYYVFSGESWRRAQSLKRRGNGFLLWDLSSLWKWVTKLADIRPDAHDTTWPDRTEVGWSYKGKRFVCLHMYYVTSSSQFLPLTINYRVY